MPFSQEFTADCKSPEDEDWLLIKFTYCFSPLGLLFPSPSSSEHSRVLVNQSGSVNIYFLLSRCCLPDSHSSSSFGNSLNPLKVYYEPPTVCAGEGNGNLLQYSCLKNLMDRGGWWTKVHGVTKSWTWMKWLSTHCVHGFWCTHRRGSLKKKSIWNYVDTSEPQTPLL